VLYTCKSNENSKIVLVAYWWVKLKNRTAQKKKYSLDSRKKEKVWKYKTCESYRV